MYMTTTTTTKMRFRFQKVVNPKPKLVLVRENKSNYILPGEELHSRRFGGVIGSCE